VPLPAEPQGAEVGDEVVDALGGRHNAVPLAQQDEMGVVLGCGVLASDHRQVRGVLRRLERHRGASVHLVREQVALRMGA
jgi:hypothetical protein